MGKKEQAHKAAWAPYQEVVAVFPRDRRFSGEDADRGTYATQRRPHFGPQSESHTNVPTLPGYTQNTSFSPEERPYIDAVRTLLNNLAAGNKVVRKEDGKMAVEKTISFEDRLVRLALQRMQDRQGVNFGYVIADASLQLLRDFKETYPNLVPALRYFFDIAGGDGIEVAAADVGGALREAMHAVRDRRSVEDAVRFFGTPRDNFYTRHREDGKVISQHDRETPGAKEVKCEDPWLGEHIGEWAKNAAVRLAADYGFVRQYLQIEDDYQKMGGSMWGHMDERPDYENFEIRNYVRKRVDALATETHVQESLRRAVSSVTGPLRRLAGRDQD